VAHSLESLRLAEESMHCRFDWAGHSDIPCVGNEQFFGKELDLEGGGWRRVRRVKIRLRTVSLPDPTTHPAENHVVTFRASEDGPSVRYRIIAVKNWYNAILELICEDANTDAT
jgi:hypothetical protein